LLSSEEMDNLMVRISRREMMALEEFYEEMSKAVYGLAYVITKSPYDAEDMYRKMLQFQELNSLLSILKKEEREIVVLYSVGFSHKEIAVILKRPYATVRWKYSNAISKLSQKEQSFRYDKASAEMESNYERT
jgi:RNA polymerase sigma-70 factor, ECF subfamily